MQLVAALLVVSSAASLSGHAPAKHRRRTPSGLQPSSTAGSARGAGSWFEGPASSLIGVDETVSSALTSATYARSFPEAVEGFKHDGKMTVPKLADAYLASRTQATLDKYKVEGVVKVEDMNPRASMTYKRVKMSGADLQYRPPPGGGCRYASGMNGFTSAWADGVLRGAGGIAPESFWQRSGRPPALELVKGLKFECGHIIGYALGGPFLDPNNYFPQTVWSNRGSGSKWARAERNALRVIKYLSESVGASARSMQGKASDATKKACKDQLEIEVTFSLESKTDPVYGYFARRGPHGAAAQDRIIPPGGTYRFSVGDACASALVRDGFRGLFGFTSYRTGPTGAVFDEHKWANKKKK